MSRYKDNRKIMQVTQFDEKSLEALIEKSLLTDAGYAKADSRDYDQDFCVNRQAWLRFIKATQPKVWEHISKVGEEKVLQRLNAQIKSKGIIEILRNGFKDQQHTIRIYNKMPASKLNPNAVELYSANEFAVCRQLYYSGENRNSLDMVIFLNGLPIITLELKNRQTGQTYHNAIRQYKDDRDPREPLFYFGRCIVHFALDQDEVYMTTRLAGDKTYFLPFNKGYKKGKGNPPNPNGERSAYLWEDILSKANLSLIIERFARKVTEVDADTQVKSHKQIFPRYHQFDVVTKLLQDTKNKGTGERYLIQHSAGSGKSNSITWLAHQLSNLHHDNNINVFDSVIVVTDRRVLDRQIRDNIMLFSSGVKGAVKAVTKGSFELRQALQDGAKVIVTTVQKFPYIVDSIETLSGNKFAIIIDEAHSSQTGKSSAKMNASLATLEDNESDKSTEDILNEIIEKKKMLKNASYFAFTATPKNKTLELFGLTSDEGKYHPYHLYSMKQAIDEGFILDVLKNYTTYGSYYKLNKIVEENPKVNEKKAKQKLKAYVEGHEYPIKQKAAEMVHHFLHNVQYRIKRKAKAMVVCQSIAKAIDYYQAIKDELATSNSPFKVIIAFSGTKKINDIEYSEERFNGFPSSDITKEFEKHEYRFLVVANKFQTGFDQPLLHTMYVDKKLGGVQAVQTLSRLNRCFPGKKDTFVLDFFNSTDEIKSAFEKFYTTTVLSEGTDPNRLNDMIDKLDGAHVYSWHEIDLFVHLYLKGVERNQLEPILDQCKEELIENLSKEKHYEFYSTGIQFCRTYDFLSKILSYNDINYEKMACFLKLFLPKIKPEREQGEDELMELLASIELDSYKLEKSVDFSITLSDDPYELDPDISGSGKLSTPEAEYSLLDRIVEEFNQRFGNDVKWLKDDKVRKIYLEEIPRQLQLDESFKEILKNSSKQNARLASEEKIESIIQNFIFDNTEAYKMFMDNKDFKRIYFDHVFSQVCDNLSNAAATQSQRI